MSPLLILANTKQPEWMACFVGYIAHQGVSITSNWMVSFPQHVINCKHRGIELQPRSTFGASRSLFKSAGFPRRQGHQKFVSVFGLRSLWNIFVRVVVVLARAVPALGTLQHGLSPPIWNHDAFVHQIPSPPYEQKKPRKEGSKSIHSCYPIKLVSIRIIL